MLWGSHVSASRFIFPSQTPTKLNTRHFHFFIIVLYLFLLVHKTERERVMDATILSSYLGKEILFTILYCSLIAITSFFALFIHRFLFYSNNYKSNFLTPPPAAAATNNDVIEREEGINNDAINPHQIQKSISQDDAFHPKKFDVFISFRGEDTRGSFTSHLRDALLRKQITTFVDDKLIRGDEISTALLDAIQDSHISVIVLSENYASSKWCLDELAKILECKRSSGQDVIPVFYGVDPSHVRNQRGSYEKAFAEHERRFKNNQLKKWKQALTEAANLSGWDSCIYRDESRLIQEIVEDVLRKLEYKYPPRKLQGTFVINENLAHVESLFKEVQTIGIWGMGGIGKTTIAKWLFDKYSFEFHGSCFLPNIRENSGELGRTLDGLRHELLSKLLDDEKTTNVHSGYVMNRLRSKRFLIVLDDVSTLEQIEYLVGELQHSKSHNRIIITTRDKDVLKKGVDEIYEVKVLNFQESLQLFSLKAFDQKHPMTGYEELSKMAIDYAKGMPLAVEVLGSFLHSKTKKEWESELQKLKRIPEGKIQSVLKLSYNGLDYEEREIFLEIACFLKGDNKEHVINLLVSYGFAANIGLRTLQDKALITIREDEGVGMHDMIQEMGREIVRQECIEEPGRRSRLWDPKEIYDVLKNNKGTLAIKGVSLDVSQIGELHLSADAFKNLTDLRYFNFYLPSNAKYRPMYLSSRLRLFSDKLSYFQWNGYPSKSLPLGFCPEKLVELLMPNNHLQKLWDGVQNLASLKEINLKGSRWLKELPDFSLALNLEEINLTNCESLCHVHPSILSLHSLVSLLLQGCKKLKSLKSEIKLRSLRHLDLEGCASLKKFCVLSEEMSDVDLSNTSIKVLPSFIGSNTVLLLCNCKKLISLPSELPQSITYLDLSGSNIECLPASIRQLTMLKTLYLSDCKKLHSLPPELPQSITHLFLNGINIECLPASIKQLTKLITVHLKECKKLRSLPVELPQSITTLHLSGSNIEFLPASIKQLTMLDELYLSNCKKLHSLPPELPQSIRSLFLNGSNIEHLPESMKKLTRLYNLDLSDCKRLQSLPELPSVSRIFLNNSTSLVTAKFGTPWKDLVNGTITIEFVNCVKLDKHAQSSILETAYSSINQTRYWSLFRGKSFFPMRMPGSRVPEWFNDDNRSKGDSITIQNNPSSKIKAWVFCVVLSPFSFNPEEDYFYIKCYGASTSWKQAWRYIELNSDHIHLWVLQLNTFLDTPCTSPNSSFKFIVESHDHEGKPLPSARIKECGILPIYASEGEYCKSCY
ncbi:hypothetical protein RIF29_35313 [Crotalaria pallida]|uniref:TIR domain-containing protein n=1 Tax=Crotalaria pallida TaxID=3830 RepID=A0AAN9EFR2_CROPI